MDERWTYNKVTEEQLREGLNHVVHFAVQVIAPEHVSVLLADFLDSFKGPFHVLGRLLLLELLSELWD